MRRLRSLLENATSAEQLGYFVDRDNEVEKKILSTKVAAKEMRANLVGREAKMSWQQEWQYLLDEEFRIDEDLQKWMAENRDIESSIIDEPLSPVQSEAQLLSDLRCIRVGDVYSAYLQRSYEFELYRKTLKNELCSVRSAVTSYKVSIPGLNRSKAKAVARAGIDRVSARLVTEKDTISSQLVLAEKYNMEVNLTSILSISQKNDSNLDINDNLLGIDIDNDVESNESLDDEINTSEFILRSPMNKHKLRRRVEMIRAKSSFELEKVGASTCLDADLIKRLTDEFAALCAVFDADVASLNRSWRETCRECNVDDNTNDELGGWIRDDHLAYLQALRMSMSMRIVTRVGNTTDGADDDSALSGHVYDTTVNLILRMSGGTRKLTRSDVLSHHKYTVARRFFLQRISARKAQFQRENVAFLESARLQFATAHEEEKDRRRREYEREEHELVRRVTHAKLEKQRAQKAVEDAVAAAIKASEAEAEDHIAEAVRIRRAAHFKTVKEALEKYKEEERALQDRIKSVREAVALAEAERRAASLVEGHERVQFREQLIIERAKKAKDLEAEARTLEIEKAALLEKLVATVPYRERIEEIATTADAARLTAHTETSAASAALSTAYATYLKAVKSDSEESALLATHDNLDFATAAKVVASKQSSSEPLAAAVQRASSDNLLTLAHRRIKEQGLFPKHGFTDRQVTSDKRFRYLASVYASGVQATTAARSAFGSLPTRVSSQNITSQ